MRMHAIGATLAAPGHGRWIDGDVKVHGAEQCERDLGRNGHALFLEHLEDIERVIGLVCERAGWYASEAEAFRSWAVMKLLEDDSRILRRFQGRSTIRTYLTTVITNLMRDYRTARFGKRRPSRQALRLGDLAVELDRLINRDRMSASEAIRVLTCRTGCEATDAELRQLAAGLPRRQRPRFVSAEHLDDLPEAAGADARLLEAERRAVARRIAVHIEACLATLDEEDQAFLRLRFWNGLTVADVARALGLAQRPIYRTIERSLRRLAEALEARGIGPREVLDAVEGTH